MTGTRMEAMIGTEAVGQGHPLMDSPLLEQGGGSERAS